VIGEEVSEVVFTVIRGLKVTNLARDAVARVKSPQRREVKTLLAQSR
jgi:gamma-glutamyl phosphate reductase